MRCQATILYISLWACLIQSLPAFASTEGIRSYQTASLQIPPDRKQAIGMDIERYYSAGNLWDTLRAQFNLPTEEDNPRVQEKMKWYYSHPDYLVRTMKRASPWLYFILEQAKKRHLPAELVLLPVIESAFNPLAQNAASGAAGMWQMMPDTASGYGLRKNWWYDGRLDVVASTTAALDHLAYLQNTFKGNWLLALAAYDAGEGTVQAAIRKNTLANKNTDYWSLPLPRETREYVPQLLALAAIIRHPEFYPSELPMVPDAPYLAEVKTGSQIDLRLAASLADMQVDHLRRLNPGYNRPATDPSGPFRLVLPIEKVTLFTENLKHIDHFPAQSTQSDSQTPYTLQPGDTLYMVRQGDTLAKITQHFHVKPDHIKMLDGSPSSPLFIGQRLAIATHASKKPEPRGDILYTVRANESIEEIAERFHIPLATLRVVNLLTEAVTPGDQIVIPAIG